MKRAGCRASRELYAILPTGSGSNRPSLKAKSAFAFSAPRRRLEYSSQTPPGAAHTGKQAQSGESQNRDRVRQSGGHSARQRRQTLRGAVLSEGAFDRRGGLWAAASRRSLPRFRRRVAVSCAFRRNRVRVRAPDLGASNIPNPAPHDWIGLFRVGDDAHNYIAYSYTGGAASGTATFTAPSQPGTYEFRYLLSNTWEEVRRSSSFSVTP